jgi:hypothetical protein
MEDLTAPSEALSLGLRTYKQASDRQHQTDLFRRLATDLRSMAKDIQGVIAEIPAALLARADNRIE